jgi:CRISPR-associated protein Cmr6
MKIRKISREEAIQDNRRRLQKHSKRNALSIKEQKSSSKSFSSSPIGNIGREFYMSPSYGKKLIDKNVSQLLKTAQKYLAITHTKTFMLETLYPGLLIGAGYAHPKLKENNDDFQLGFFFDHTTGLPVIPGSSIKGMLRALLPIDGDVDSKRAYVKELYEWDDAFIDDLCNCFEDGKTIFYDAYIVSTNDEKGRIFAEDYVTSHFSDEPMGMFKEPNPVRFIKIRPGVSFQFQFGTDDEKVVDAFKQLLIDHGVGAKTNVGYGMFQEN